MESDLLQINFLHHLLCLACLLPELPSQSCKFWLSAIAACQIRIFHVPNFEAPVKFKPRRGGRAPPLRLSRFYYVTL